MPKEGLTSIQLRINTASRESIKTEAFEAENKVVRDNFVSRTESLLAATLKGSKFNWATRKQVLKISPLNRKILMK
jgi:hypothetical protein